MALLTGISTEARNAMADAFGPLLNNGYIRYYNGTRPATVGAALSGNTLLAELRGNATFAPGASSGVLTANAITQDSSADASGTPTFARLFKSDGTTAVCDLNVGTSSADIIINPGTISAGQPVSLASLTFTVPATNP